MKSKFDFNHFMNRKQLKQKDAASLIGVSSGLVGMWASNKAVPSYEKIVKLIDNGATAEELFGKECADKLLQNSSGLSQHPAEMANKSDHLTGSQQGLEDIETKVAARVKTEILADLKTMGVIK